MWSPGTFPDHRLSPLTSPPHPPPALCSSGMTWGWKQDWQNKTLLMASWWVTVDTTWDGDGHDSHQGPPGTMPASGGGSNLYTEEFLGVIWSKSLELKSLPRSPEQEFSGSQESSRSQESDRSQELGRSQELDRSQELGRSQESGRSQELGRSQG